MFKRKAAFERKTVEEMIKQPFEFVKRNMVSRFNWFAWGIMLIILTRQAVPQNLPWLLERYNRCRKTEAGPRTRKTY